MTAERIIWKACSPDKNIFCHIYTHTYIGHLQTHLYIYVFVYIYINLYYTICMDYSIFKENLHTENKG